MDDVAVSEAGGSEGPPVELAGELVTASPDAIVVVDDLGAVLFASAAVQTLFGYRPEELVGWPMELLVPESLRGLHAAHRRRYAHHPSSRPMGAGLRLSGQRKDGTTFPIDVGLSPLSGGRVAAFVRDASAWTRVQRRLQATNQLTQAVLAGGSIEELMQAAAREARLLLDADGALVTDIDAEDPESGVVLAADAPDDTRLEKLIGTSFRTRGHRVPWQVGMRRPALFDRLDAAAGAGEPGAGAPGAGAPSRLPFLDLGQGPVATVALSQLRGRLQHLTVVRAAGRATFDGQDGTMLSEYAVAADVATRLGESRLELEKLSIVGEHGRIARDLHDTVIQRLFATGMSIQSVLPLLSGLPRERVSEAVAELDTTIAEIRTTIFGLQQASTDPDQLRSRVLAVAAEAASQLGFRPRVAFDGPVDTLADQQVADNLLKVLREALSNVARHAQASTADVVVAVTAATLTLTVSDDGVGPPTAPSAGNGLRNLAERAEALGGSLQLSRRTTGGTRLQWNASLQRA